MEQENKDAPKIHRRSYNYRTPRPCTRDPNKFSSLSRSLVRMNSSEKLTSKEHRRNYSSTSPSSSVATAISKETSMQAFNFNLNPIFIKNCSILALSKCEVSCRVGKDRLYLHQSLTNGADDVKTPMFQIISRNTVPLPKPHHQSKCCLVYNIHCNNYGFTHPYVNGKHSLEYLKVSKKSMKI